jgi:hypothetical protein
MKLHLIFVGLSATLWAGPALSQTADHAPTKPAADAAARYDRSLQQSAPSNLKNKPADSSSGASTGAAGDDPMGNSAKTGQGSHEGAGSTMPLDRAK